MSARLTKAVDGVLDALDNEGRSPTYHRRALARLRREWPVLWSALEELRHADAATPRPSTEGGDR